MLERYRALLKRPDGPFSRWITKPLELACLPLVVRLPFSPNFWTLASFIAKIAAAWWIFAGEAWWPVPVLLAAALILDGFDGDVARWRNQKSFFGACLDTATDVIGSMLILIAFLNRMLDATPDSRAWIPAFLLLAIEVAYQTLWVWISVTGVMLREHLQLASWDRTARERGYLCVWFIDSLYFSIAVLPFIMPPVAVAITMAVCAGCSIVYLARVHLAACERALDGSLIRAGLRRKLSARALGFGAGLAAGWLAVTLGGLSPRWLLFFVSLEYVTFYLIIIGLLKRSALMPQDPGGREAFLKDLRNRDREFLARIWP